MLAADGDGIGEDEGNVDTQLSGSAEQQGDGVGQQRAKVGHRTYAHEDEAGEDGRLNAAVDDTQNAGIIPVNIGQLGLGSSQFRDKRWVGRIGGQCGRSILHRKGGGFGGIGHNTGIRQVGQHHTKSDGQQQQRLKTLYNGAVQQHKGNEQHDALLPAEISKAGASKGLAENS